MYVYTYKIIAVKGSRLEYTLNDLHYIPISMYRFAYIYVFAYMFVQVYMYSRNFLISQSPSLNFVLHTHTQIQINKSRNAQTLAHFLTLLNSRDTYEISFEQAHTRTNTLVFKNQQQKNNSVRQTDVWTDNFQRGKPMLASNNLTYIFFLGGFWSETCGFLFCKVPFVECIMWGPGLRPFTISSTHDGTTRTVLCLCKLSHSWMMCWCYRSLSPSNFRFPLTYFYVSRSLGDVYSSYYSPTLTFTLFTNNSYV